LDREKAWRFIEHFTDMAAGTTTIALLAVADRTGLLTAMAGRGPMTTGDVSAAAGLEQRYVTEIMSGLAAGGVLAYDGSTERFTLPDEHAAVVADDDSPYAMVGWLDMLPATMHQLDHIVDATRHGGGVPFEDFGEDMVRGIDRGNSPSMRLLLTRKWLSAMPDIVEQLETGGSIADVGCGSGAAVLAMATAYPEATVWGFDLHHGSVERARARAGRVPNARFEVRAADDLPLDVGFDLVTTFDVVHDLADPPGALRRIKESLVTGGTYLMMEPRAEDNLEDNLNPRGALLYGVSALHCMTQSLAMGGAGLGAAWGPAAAEALCRDAGFGSFTELPIDNPFSAFYRVG